MNKYVFSIVLVVFFLGAGLLLGCSHSKNARKSSASSSSTHEVGPFGTRAASVYMPLNLGNSWVYDRFFLGEEGVLKINIVSRDKEGFYVDNKGGRFKLTSMGLRDINRYMLLAPLEKGGRWDAQVTVNISEHFEIIADNETITVPAGSFEHCLIVRSVTMAPGRGKMVNMTTYAPNVGMIRVETLIENEQGRSSRQMLLDLKSYEFPPTKPYTQVQEVGKAMADEPPAEKAAGE